MSENNSFPKLRELADKLKAAEDAQRRQKETADAAAVALALVCILGWLFWLTYTLAKAGLL